MANAILSATWLGLIDCGTYHSGLNPNDDLWDFEEQVQSAVDILNEKAPKNLKRKGGGKGGRHKRKTVATRKLIKVEIDTWKFDNAGFLDALGKCAFKQLEPMLKDVKSKLPMVTDFKYHQVWSPREYNFQDDQLEIEAVLTDDWKAKVAEWYNAMDAEEKSDFEDWSHEKFGSRPGFDSIMPTGIDEVLESNCTDHVILQLVAWEVKKLFDSEDYSLEDLNMEFHESWLGNHSVTDWLDDAEYTKGRDLLEKAGLW